MFHKRKIKILAFVLTLFFLCFNVKLVHAQAQPDNFPIGLYVVYTADSHIPPGEEEIYTIGYEFKEWVNQDTLLIEYEKDGITYIEHLWAIYHDGPEHPPIWLDVSLLHTQSVFTFSGYLYHYVGIEELWTPGLQEDCYRLEYSITVNGMENWSIVYYHCETGILVDYIHAAFYEDYSPRELYLEEISGTNLGAFNPPTFTVTEQAQTSTTTTIITTSTTQNPETPVTTSTTTGLGTTSPMSITSTTVFLSIGVVIECIIIVLIFSRRDQYNQGS
ncbi:hypothetical protein EU528_08455 [Candidatus Thorarchaeota archaeon]|nr:MAG: hypothetical protein EU528_08455 [Candidatus Thorarchaeota archaeon]